MKRTTHRPVKFVLHPLPATFLPNQKRSFLRIWAAFGKETGLCWIYVAGKLITRRSFATFFSVSASYPTPHPLLVHVYPLSCHSILLSSMLLFFPPICLRGPLDWQNIHLLALPLKQGMKSLNGGLKSELWWRSSCFETWFCVKRLWHCVCGGETFPKNWWVTDILPGGPRV